MEKLPRDEPGRETQIRHLSPAATSVILPLFTSPKKAKYIRK